MSRPGWIDLAAPGQRRYEALADVCVIGAGAAGIYLTLQLAKQGRRVVLIEAGPAKCADASTVGFDTLFEASHYPGATTGRFFGIGGSTSDWGGVLVPHTNNDLREGTTSTETWQDIVNTVSEKATCVLQQLGYRSGWDFDSFADRLPAQALAALRSSGLHIQAGLYLPFRRKNFAVLLNHTSAQDAAPRIFFNAVAKSWTADAGYKEGSRLAKLVAVSRNNNELVVNAEKFVVTAGAIESARILLEINDSFSLPVVRPTAATGCYLADHLSVPIADVVPDCVALAAHLFAPRFSGSWMRSFRFLDTDSSQNAHRSFAHFIFSNPSRGFELAKEVLGAMQRRRMPSISRASVRAGAGDLMRLAYHRFVNAVLYIPPGTPAHLQLDMEQGAVRENHVTLSRQKDVYGRRLASIHWQVTDMDLANIRKTALRFLEKWPGAKAGLPQLVPRAMGSDTTNPFDAYHPVGTCRMGEDAEAVVDRNLKVYGVQNLWVASTGVLPSGGTANPTFTMLCLTQQLAEHLHTLR